MNYISRLFSEFNSIKAYKDFSYLSEMGLLHLTEETLLQNKRIMVIAAQGMGKSTFVRELKKHDTSILLIYLTQETENSINNISTKDVSVIIFDSLDEVTINIRNCVFNFCKNNQDCNIIITSRPSAYINTPEGFRIFNLLHFTKENISEVLKNEGINAVDFFNKTDKVNITESCGNPMQFQIAIKMFKNNHMDIGYYESLKLFIKDSLCETDDTKKSAYTNDEIYECAKWIATSMALSNKTAVYCGQEKNCNEHQLSISDLTGKFDKALIEETLKRVPFKLIDKLTYTFTNLLFRDFLAGDGIKDNINHNHWMRLFIGGDYNVAYSGAENTLSWLALFNEDIFTYLFENEPWKLYSNTSLFQKKSKLEVFRQLYSIVNTIPYNELHSHSLKNLYCDDVENEIIKILREDGLNYGFYSLIIFIIDYPNYELAKYLLEMLKDAKDHRTIEKIIYILSKSKDEEIINNLKSLLNKGDIFKDDDNDEVKGYLLRACYKELELKEILSYLHKEKRRYFYGSYITFINELSSRIDSVINNDNKTIALEWMEEIFKLNTSNGITPNVLERNNLATLPLQFAKSIITYIWKELFDDKVISFYIPLFDTYDYTGFFNIEVYGKRASISSIKKEELGGDDDKIVKVIFEGIINNKITPNHFSYSLSPPRDKKIIENIIERNVQLGKEYINKLEAEFTTDFINENNELLNKLTELSLAFKTVDEYINDYDERLKQYEKMNSERIRKISREENKSAKEENKILENNRNKILEKLGSNNEDSSIFIWVVDYVIRTESNNYYKKIVDSKFYSDLNDTQKEILRNRAIDYLNLRTFKGNELELLHALILVFDFDDTVIKKINQNFWKSNIIHIMTSSTPHGIEDFNLDKVVNFIYEEYPSDCEEAIINIVNNFNNQNYRQVISVWGDRISHTLLEKLLSFCENSSEFIAIRQLLNDLTGTKYKANLVNFIYGYIKENINNKVIEERYAIFLAIGLKLDFNHFLASFISLEERDSDSFKMTVEKVAEEYSYSINITLTPLDPNQFATLYIALEKHYSYENKPKYNTVYTVGDIDRIYDFKNIALNSLTNTGVKGSFKAVQHIINQCPHMDGLNRTLTDIRKNEILSNKIPLSSKEIKELYLNSNKELIKSSKDLLDFVVSQLAEYEKHLQGKYDQVVSLWDGINENAKPKDEGHLSSNIGAFLELSTKDIVIAREVQVKVKRHRVDKGSRADILISVIDRELNDIYTLCIEVKRSKNSEIKNNFKTQLIDKYMTYDRADSGIFLVGYFGDDYLHKFKGVEDIKQLKSYLKVQEEKYKQDDKYIKGLVIDCRLNHSEAQNI